MAVIFIGPRKTRKTRKSDRYFGQRIARIETNETGDSSAAIRVIGWQLPLRFSVHGRHGKHGNAEATPRILPPVSVFSVSSVDQRSAPVSVPFVDREAPSPSLA